MDQRSEEGSEALNIIQYFVKSTSSLGVLVHPWEWRNLLIVKFKLRITSTRVKCPLLTLPAQWVLRPGSRLQFVRKNCRIAITLSVIIEDGKRLAVNRGNVLAGLLIVPFALCVLLQSACAQGGVERDPDRGGIDRRLTGTWLLLEQSNIMPSDRVPPAVTALHIRHDGRVEGVGVDAASGTLSLGCPLYTFLRGRDFLWADSTGLQFTQLDFRAKGPVLGTGKWRLDGNLLRLELHNSLMGKWSEKYMRVSLGDSVAASLRIHANILVKGDTLPLNEVSSAPPGSVNVMRLDTATHMTIYTEGRTKDGLDAGISVRVHDIDGPGVYSVEVEQQSGGHMSIMDRDTGSNQTFSRASAGTVTIEELDLETMRCRGRLDVHFDHKHLRSPMRSLLHVTGSFDLPVWISNEYDIKIFRVDRPAGYKEVVP